MKKPSLALAAAALAALALQAPAAWSQAATSRADVKADTVAAAKKGAITPSTEVDPENQKTINPPAKAPAAKPHRMKKADGAASSGK